ncbi:flocculin [Rhodotorula toruloides]|uniref:Flocculin n=1 Tax=Rhodotorula toruloides TaxID=5286 RepID=A0A511KA89_RHOTO|nr:flocculin [Rhodotorula toruloides]
MKAALWSLVASTAATLVVAAPPFVLQDARLPTRPAAERLADLTPNDFHAIQDALRESFEHLVDEGKRLVQDTFEAFEDDLVKTQDDRIHPPHPPSHPIPPPVIDLSKYTILEIVNQSFHRHHEHEDSEVHLVDRMLREGLAARRPCKHARTVEGKGERSDEHDHQLPLHRLAWLVNFAPEAAKLLERDGITLLAPDDMALTPPHRRNGGGHHGFAGEPERSVEDMMAATLSERSHPFHSHEFSPEKLAKLAASDDDDDDDDDGKEEKKRIFRKIIALVGAYHVIPESQNSHELMDRSTVPTLLDESRVRVSPGFETFPFPHPTLKFNVYSHKRGPTVIAKNGIIHLVSAPLFPPWTVLNELFVFPGAFAGLTNAIQKVGLDEPLLPPNDADTKLPEDDFVGSPFIQGIVEELAAEKGLDSFTVFAPSNAAFAKLGWKINGFLHSPLPFAKKVLKYLLSYHVAPGVRFYSDFLHNDSSIASDAHKYIVKEEIDVEVPLEWVTEGNSDVFHPSDWSLPPFPRREHPHPPPHVPEHPHPGPRANITHYVLPTLLTEHNPNATLKIGVVSYRSFFGKGPIRRNVIVFPSHGHHHEHHAAMDDGDVRRVWGHEGGDEHGRIPRPHPVKVAFTDVPARAGAIQVLGHDFLLPPPPPHKEHEHDADLVSLAQKEARRLAKAIHKLFA